jgi:hypothetical protein
MFSKVFFLYVCGGYVVACFRFMFFLEYAQSPDYDFFNIFYDLFLCSFGILLPMFQTNNKNIKTNKNKQPVSGLWPWRGWWAFKHCIKQTLDKVSMKQKTSTGSRGNWTTMTNVSWWSQCWKWKHRPLPLPSWRLMPQWKYPPSNI